MKSVNKIIINKNQSNMKRIIFCFSLILMVCVAFASSSGPPIDKSYLTQNAKYICDQNSGQYILENPGTFIEMPAYKVVCYWDKESPITAIVQRPQEVIKTIGITAVTFMPYFKNEIYNTIASQDMEVPQKICSTLMPIKHNYQKSKLSGPYDTIDQKFKGGTQDDN